jgi:hypothetical protein
MAFAYHTKMYLILFSPSYPEIIRTHSRNESDEMEVDKIQQNGQKLNKNIRQHLVSSNQEDHASSRRPTKFQLMN